MEGVVVVDENNGDGLPNVSNDRVDTIRGQMRVEARHGLPQAVRQQHFAIVPSLFAGRSGRELMTGHMLPPEVLEPGERGLLDESVLAELQRGQEKPTSPAILNACSASDGWVSAGRRTSRTLAAATFNPSR